MRERRKRYASSQHPYTQIGPPWGNKQQTKHHHRRRRVLFEEKTKRERERERDPSEKRRPKRIIVIIIGKRNGRTMRDALKDTRSFVCTQHSRGGGFSLCFIFRVSKKKEKKKEEGKRKDCVTVFALFVRSLRSRLFPPKALTTTTTTTHHHHHHSFCSRRRRMIPNALHKPFYTVRCSFVLSLCLSSTQQNRFCVVVLC